MNLLDIYDIKNDVKNKVLASISAAYELGLKSSSNTNYNKGYNCGLNDSWECAKKIVSLWIKLEAKELFETDDIYCIFNKNTPSQAIKKIMEHEKKSEEGQQESNEIHIGDEVMDLDGNKRAVIDIQIDNIITIWGENGITRIDKQFVSKTGRHFDEIEKVLNQIIKC